jgi:hypothetical protein
MRDFVRLSCRRTTRYGRHAWPAGTVEPSTGPFRVSLLLLVLPVSLLQPQPNILDPLVPWFPSMAATTAARTLRPPRLRPPLPRPPLLRPRLPRLPQSAAVLWSLYLALVSQP